jgi:hypothetical protein
MAYNDLPVILNSGRYMANDCSQVFYQKSLNLVGSCSDAFDYVLQYSQSAANPAVVLSNSNNSTSTTMTTPYSCARATATSCPAGCQADVTLIYSNCFAGNTVLFAGNGLPIGPYNNGAEYNYVVGTLALAGTDIPPASAYAALQGGYGSLPTNLKFGLNSIVPLTLSNCTNGEPTFRSAGRH